jgi:glycosyltransferase involved in cell wall biosynthesis
MNVITFLQPSIPMVVLAAQNLPNRIIISERGNPERLMKKRYGKRFIEKYFRSIDVAVFQTEDAKNKYPVNVQEKGVVIPNPLKEGLPQPYTGERNKTISTFCRISKQKNLPLLVHAFALLHKEHPEYSLRIIGDTLNEEGILVQKELENDIKKAVEERELLVYFQPKFDVKSEKVTGAEALVRWNHPERGMLYPESFVPLCEANGYICTIDFYVLEEGCKRLKL